MMHITDFITDKQVIDFISKEPGTEYSLAHLMHEFGLGEVNTRTLMKRVMESGKIKLRVAGQRRYWYVDPPESRYATPPVGANLNFVPLGQGPNGREYVQQQRRVRAIIRDRELA